MEKVRGFVDVLREKFDVFNIENVINDLETCVESFGVKVYYSDMQSFKNPNDISGYSRVNSKGLPEIVVNGNQSAVRRRFTIAHELGHIIMHWRWLNQPGQRLNENLQEVLFRKKDYDAADTLRERQANEFAAELLAPLELVRKESSNFYNLTQFQQIFIKSSLANAFKISDQFAEIQLKKSLRGS